jgi:hypothetical protein
MEFYGASDPADIPWDRILGAHRFLLAGEGLTPDWHLVQHRAGALKWLGIKSSFLFSTRYLVLGVTRAPFGGIRAGTVPRADPAGGIRFRD